MTSKKIYRYLGRNGILTTHILIEGANYIPLVELTADKGKVLTNGEKTVYSSMKSVLASSAVPIFCSTNSVESFR